MIVVGGPSRGGDCNSVISIHCEAPANGPNKRLRTKCWHCGEAVCKPCSRIKVNCYKGKGYPKRVRVCASCLHDHYKVDL